MGLIKNLLVGGSRPKQDGETVRCGDCRESVQPDATRCPNCNAKIFTARGRIVRRTSIILAILFLVGGVQSSGIVGMLMVALALGFVVIGVYYYLKRPVHSIRPPHRPTRPDRPR